MCLDEFNITFSAGEKFLTRKGDLCNKNLSLNRGLVCQALSAFKSISNKTITCLDGNTPCGLMGMLWKKYMGEDVKVDINGIFFHSTNVIQANLKSNEVEANVLREDVCVLLRQRAYDFIYLNCKTATSHYLDSVFSKAGQDCIIAVTSSEDPSLYWQSPNVALRNYGGVIVRTTYFRELGIRLVIAEMARAAARYAKGITVLCSASFKAQQSFTIIVKVRKGSEFANGSVHKIKRLVHCSVCEDRFFMPNSEFVIESPSLLLSCDCCKNAEAKTMNLLGPIWSGEIFDPDFVELMLSKTKNGYPWESKILLLLLKIVEEAKCPNGNAKEPESKKLKLDGVEQRSNSEVVCESQPPFYFNIHKHHPANRQLLKCPTIVEILRKEGYRASRTHFDPESVRTNASLRDLLQLLERHS